MQVHFNVICKLQFGSQKMQFRHPTGVPSSHVLLYMSQTPALIIPVDYCEHFNQLTLSYDVFYCIPRTKYVRGILWFSRRYAAAAAAAASAAAASADTSSFSR